MRPAVKLLIFLMLTSYQPAWAVGTLLRPPAQGPAPAVQTSELLEQAERARVAGDYAGALAALGRAKALAERAQDRAALADVLGKIGNVLRLRGDYAEALKHLRESITLSEALGDKSKLAFALNTVADVHLARGEFDLLLEHARRSLALSEEANDKAGIARSHNSLGAYYRTQSDLTQALSHYQIALRINEELGDKGAIALLLYNIGNTQMALENYTDSFEIFKRGLAISQEIQDARRTADLFNMLGINHRALGDEEQALEHFRQGLVLQERIQNKVGAALSLEYIGVSLFLWKEDRAGAAGYFQKAHKLYETLGDRHGVARTQKWLGNVHYARGDYAAALASFEKVLKVFEETGDKSGAADALINLSDACRGLGEHERALEVAERAATLGMQIGVYRFVTGARTAAGKAYRALGRKESALEAFADAVAHVELSRSKLTGHERRAAYFTTVREPYDLYVELSMQMHRERPSEGRDRIAFQMSERARARSLLEALAEAKVDIRQAVAPELLDRERALQQQLNAAARRRASLTAGKNSAEEGDALKRELNALAAEYEQVKTQLRRHSPRYAALTMPHPLTLEEIQRRVLDRETALLHYAFGDERSYLWAVTTESVESFELPRREEIEKAVRGVYELLSDAAQWEAGATAGRRYTQEAGRLSRVLLGPVAAKLKGRRLLVVGDGALQYLPFGALPSPTGGERPLVAENEVVSLPSASTLAVLRQEKSSRARAPKGVAVIADPVFEPGDERLAAASTRGDARPASADGGRFSQAAFARRQVVRTLSARERSGGDRQAITRLAFSRREAESILANAPAGEGFKAVDFDASRETATSPALAQYRLVHYATHGVLDSEHPELSGIVLSLVDREGRPVDGYLRLHEIYNLDLPADLVVLSACQTALGKEIRGEGLVGLTRGFMYAGSPRVVASLWKVNDAATASLMGRFYRGMLKEGRAPAAALRAAQVEMLKHPRWRAPYYWAAFQLQGEWR